MCSTLTSTVAHIFGAECVARDKSQLLHSKHHWRPKHVTYNRHMEKGQLYVTQDALQMLFGTSVIHREEGQWGHIFIRLYFLHFGTWSQTSQTPVSGLFRELLWTQLLFIYDFCALGINLSPNLVRRACTSLQEWIYGSGVVCSCLQKQTGLRRPPSEEQRGLSGHPAGFSALEPGSEMGNTGEHLVYKQMSNYRPDGPGPANQHKQNESVKVKLQLPQPQFGTIYITFTLHLFVLPEMNGWDSHSTTFIF